MKKKWISAIGLLVTLASPCAWSAGGDPDAGAGKAVVCMACHGANGNQNINPEWPNLAGQHAGYLAAQLKLFKEGVRNNAVMMPNAMLLSEQDMLDIAAHFARQPVEGLEADPSLYKAGERLYRGGDAARDLPACIACHGPQGKGNGPAQYPAVRAQHSVYSYNQLVAYASGERQPVSNNIMQTVAGKLTFEEMKALASYMQGLR